jgi:hypothetical protein
MNYAEDRIDRRARHAEGKDLLWKDYIEALQSQGSTVCINHELLARTLRDIGWNSHALYHYGQAWCEEAAAAVAAAASDDLSSDSHDQSWKAAGDYAQMAELAGFPEVGVLALLVYRARGDLQSPASTTALTRTEFINWIHLGCYRRNHHWVETADVECRNAALLGISFLAKILLLC